MSMEARPTLLALPLAELRARVIALGGQAFHAKIVRRNVLGKGMLEYDAMTSLPASLRKSLSEELPILAGREAARSVALDRTTKLLLEFPRGKARADATIETVHMPALGLSDDDEEFEERGERSARDLRGDESARGLRDDERNRDASDTRAEDILPAGGDEVGRKRGIHGVKQPRGATLCVSTQIGCPVGCPFCASGALGLARNLESHEILEQYVRGRAIGPLARSVVMGMGEPLLNYANLAIALDAVHDEMGLGSRKITVSTVGFPDRLRALAPKKPRFQLAISLHTPDQEQRDELVPAMKGVAIEEILSAGDDWFAKTGREITYEYVLLGGQNDSSGHAQRLAARLRNRRCRSCSVW